MKKLLAIAIVLLATAVLAASPQPVTITPTEVGGGVSWRLYATETSGSYLVIGTDYLVETTDLSIPVDTAAFSPYADKVLFMAVTSVGATGLESRLSNEVTRTIPPNPPVIE